MSNFIHALEMEDDDENGHDLSDNVALINSNSNTGNTTNTTNGTSTRDALNKQLQKNLIKSTTTTISPKMKSILRKIGIGFFIVILLVYAITYRVEERIDNNDILFENDDNNTPDDTTAANTAPSSSDADVVPGPTPLESKSIPVLPVVVTEAPSTTNILIMNELQIENDNKELKYSEISTIISDPFSYITNTTIDKWGKWKFWDGDENNRPLSEDYCGKYPNRDIPGDQFPKNAWQTDAVFVNHIVNDGEKLLSRAKEAILSEYGYSREGLRAEQLKTRLEMFHIDKITTTKMKDSTIPDRYIKKKGNRDNGGYMSTRSWDGLVRRLLHAIMTNDEFVIVLGGHSAAAGHGNHFHQSYSMQLHKILYPIFSRLGVKLITKNMCQGGLGTLQNSIGMKSLYDSNIDVLLWDSGMTESDVAHVDLFFRQGLVSGTNKIPFLLSGTLMWNVLSFLHDEADADVGEYGTGMAGITEITSDEQAQTVPYAARYIKCSKEYSDTNDYQCNNNRFCAHCWSNRSDVNASQFISIDTKVPSQVKWHPGWRVHQLQGRVLAFTLIDALQDAMQILSSQTMGGPPLDDSFWHVTTYYNNIRTKILQLGNQGECSKIQTDIPQRLCTIPLTARSAFTPRNNPTETSLSTIIVPYTDDGYVPTNQATMIYDTPDVHNYCYNIPTDAIDVLSIISNRRRRRLSSTSTLSSSSWTTKTRTYKSLAVKNKQQQQPIHAVANSNNTDTSNNNNRINNTVVERQLGEETDDTTIVPGSGWVYVFEPPGQCDGQYNSICGRAASSTCPMIGHHDSRGMIQGNEYSGWILFTLPKVEYGIILLKVITYATDSTNWKTTGWTSVNNKSTRKRRQLLSNNSNLFMNNTNNNNISLNTMNDIQGMEQQQEDDPTYNEQLVKGRPKQQQQQKEQQRVLKETADVTNYPNTTIFEYAINNKIIKSLTKDELIQFIKKPQRVIEIMTLLDDINYTIQTNVQVAIRLRNCGHDCPFGISHIYWA